MERKLTIIKVGGALVEDAVSLQALLERFAAIGGDKILVHGGGRTATAVAAKLGVETRMVDGRRVTDKETLEVVTMVYGGLVNKNIVAKMQATGTDAVGLTGADMNIIVSRRRKVKEVDYGFVGDVERVNTLPLLNLLNAGAVPVIAPLTHDGKGSLLNTNADTMAATTAMAMAQHRKVALVYCFEKKGVLSDPDNEDSVIPTITAADFPRLAAEGIISGGMLPKIENALHAVEMGVAEVRITSALNLNGGTVIK
jgi:acetylglutamate kinase